MVSPFKRITKEYPNVSHLDSLSITILAEDTVLYESPFLGQHGISLYVETLRDGVVRKILVDVGQNPLALVNNMEELSIDLDDLDAVVLTHCHYDHTRGIAQLLAASSSSGIPVIAHPDIFRPHFVVDPEWRNIGMSEEDSAERIEASGGKLILTSDPMEIFPGLYVSGEVPRLNEVELPPTGLRTSRGGMAVPDRMDDDISLYALVEGGGMTVLTGCAHAGIINILDMGAALFPGESLCGIVGGLHLIEAEPERIEWTAKTLAERSPSWVGAGHCTGFGGQMALAATLEGKFFPLRTGISIHVDSDGMEMDSIVPILF